jgi:hypothetical protein
VQYWWYNVISVSLARTAAGSHWLLLLSSLGWSLLLIDGMTFWTS